MDEFIRNDQYLKGQHKKDQARQDTQNENKNTRLKKDNIPNSA